MQPLRPIVFSLIGLLLSPSTNAQGEPSQPETEEPKARSITFTIYRWFDETRELKEQEAPPELFYRVGRNFCPITTRPAEAGSPFLSSVTQGKLILYSEVMVEDKPKYQPAHEVKIGAGTTALFLYMFTTNGKTNLLSIDTSPDKFPKSNFAFVNGSREPVDFAINGKMSSAQAKAVVVTPYTLSKEETLRIVVTSKDKRKKILSVMTVGGRKDQRIIGFFYEVNQGRAHRLLLERGVDSQALRFETPGDY